MSKEDIEFWLSVFLVGFLFREAICCTASPVPMRKQVEMEFVTRMYFGENNFAVKRFISTHTHSNTTMVLEKYIL